MAVRFRATVLGQIDGTSWRIDIDDSDHVGGITTFNAAGLSISYRGENQERYAPILPSECRFGMMIANSTLQAMITDIADSAEGRFRVGIYKGGALYWAGLVLSEIAEIENTSYPYLFNITATDGLGVLKTIDYKDTSGPYAGIASSGGEDRLSTYLLNCLKKIPHVPYFWGSSIDFLATTVNFYEAEHTYDYDFDPLYNTYLNNRAFWKQNPDTTYTYTNCYDVIKNIATIFGARIMLANGKWRVESIEARASAVVPTRGFQYDGTALASVNTAVTADVGPGLDNYVMAGGKWTFFPAMLRTEIELKSNSRRNLLAGQVFNSTSHDEVSLENINSNAQTATLRITAQLGYKLRNTSVGTTSNPVAVRFKLKLKVGTYYAYRASFFNGGTSVSYGELGWKTGSDWIEIVTPYHLVPYISSTIGAYSEMQVDIVTTALQENGQLIFDFDDIGIVGVSGGTAPANVVLDSWSLNQAWIELYENGLPDLESGSVTYTKINASTANTAVYKDSVLIGDGPTANSIGRLKTYDGSEYVNTTLWAVDGGTADTPIAELLAERILRGQLTARMRYNGEIGGDFFNPFVRILYDSRYYLLLSGEYDCDREVWRGEWFELLYDDITSITDGPTISSGSGYQPGGSGGNTTTSSGGGGGGGSVSHDALEPIAATKLASQAAAGSVSSLTVADTLAANAFLNGQYIVLVNPTNGQFAQLQVTANTTASSTSISVSGSLPALFPVGTFVIISQKNTVISGGVGGGTYTAGEGISISSGAIALDYGTDPSTNPGMSSGRARFGNGGLVFEGATADTYEGTLDVVGLTSDRVWTLPDQAGVLPISPSGAYIDYAQYTPTVTGTSCTIGTVNKFNFSRAGTIVTFSGSLDVTGGSGVSRASFVFTLPTGSTSNFTVTADDATGVAHVVRPSVSPDTTYRMAWLEADTTNDKIKVTFDTYDTSGTITQTCYVSGQYIIK
jgi:hypothetical protein